MILTSTHCSAHDTAMSSCGRAHDTDIYMWQSTCHSLLHMAWHIALTSTLGSAHDTAMSSCGRAHGTDIYTWQSTWHSHLYVGWHLVHTSTHGRAHSTHMYLFHTHLCDWCDAPVSMSCDGPGSCVCIKSTKEAEKLVFCTV